MTTTAITTCTHTPPHFLIGGEREQAVVRLRDALIAGRWPVAGELMAQLAPCFDLEAPRPRNGAELVEAMRIPDGWMILATWQHQWAIWQMDAAGDTFFGTYFDTADEARAEYGRRVGRWVGSAITKLAP